MTGTNCTLDAARNGTEKQRQLLIKRLADDNLFFQLTAHANGWVTLMPGQPANAACAGHRAACSGLRKSLTAALSLQRARIVHRRWLKVFPAFQPFRLANDSGALAGVETSSLRSSTGCFTADTRIILDGYSPHIMRRISTPFSARDLPPFVCFASFLVKTPRFPFGSFCYYVGANAPAPATCKATLANA
jgi:hypothetical protein